MIDQHWKPLPALQDCLLHLWECSPVNWATSCLFVHEFRVPKQNTWYSWGLASCTDGLREVCGALASGLKWRESFMLSALSSGIWWRFWIIDYSVSFWSQFFCVLSLDWLSGLWLRDAEKLSSMGAESAFQQGDQSQISVPNSVPLLATMPLLQQNTHPIPET